MSIKAYEANYNSALTFLKYKQNDSAIETLKRALSQVPGNEMNEDNAVYLSILTVLSFLLLEKHEIENSYQYVEQGLAVKKNHADLLFVKSMVLLDRQRYVEVMDALINYLLALADNDGEKFDYRYTHEGALKEVYDTLIPTAYRYTLEYDKIRDIAKKLCNATDNHWLKRAYDIMVEIDNSRNDSEH